MKNNNGTTQPFDLQKAMKHVDGDSNLFVQMAGLFQQRYRMLLESARKAIITRDQKAIDFTAHGARQDSIVRFALTVERPTKKEEEKSAEVSVSQR